MWFWRMLSEMSVFLLAFQMPFKFFLSGLIVKTIEVEIVAGYCIVVCIFVLTSSMRHPN